MALPTRLRLDALDVARGVAILAMVIYHFAWDLSFLGFIAVDVGREPGWVAFARSIAASFLVIVGISLVLAREAGQSWTKFSQRVGKIAAAAALITIATLIVFPDAFIFFGILHMIAAGSILALPFLRLPVWSTLAVALLVFAAPQFIASDAFDTRWLAWIGFAQTPPTTNDFEPVFPWFSAILVGVALGRIAVDRDFVGRIAQWRADSHPARWLAVAGRWSLVIYLVHQPILLGVLYPLAMVTPITAGPAPATFAEACVRECVAVGTSEAICIPACACTQDALTNNGFESLLEARSVGPREQELIDDVARQCFRAVREGGPDAVNPDEIRP
jgi:uncharacterized membrane protein